MREEGVGGDDGGREDGRELRMYGGRGGCTEGRNEEGEE